MSYEKQNWKDYGNLSEYIIEITIKESSGFKVGHFVAFSEQQYQQCLKTIGKKFGYRYPKEKTVPLTMTATQLKAELNIPIEEKDEKPVFSKSI